MFYIIFVPTHSIVSETQMTASKLSFGAGLFLYTHFAASCLVPVSVVGLCLIVYSSSHLCFLCYLESSL